METPGQETAILQPQFYGKETVNSRVLGKVPLPFTLWAENQSKPVCSRTKRTKHAERSRLE